MERTRKCHQIIENYRFQEHKIAARPQIWEESQASSMVGGVGSEWCSGVQQKKWGLPQQGMPQQRSSNSLLPHAFNYDQETRDALDESHIASALALLDEDESADARSGVARSSSTMYPWTNNNNSLHNYNNSKTRAMQTYDSTKLANDLYSVNNDIYSTQQNLMPAQDLLYNGKSQFNHFNSEHNENFINDTIFNKTREISYNGYKQESLYNGNKQENYNRYNKQQEWQQLNVGGNGSQDCLPHSVQFPQQPHQQQQCSNGEIPVWPQPNQGEVGELSPSLPSQAGLLNYYRQLQEAQEHPPTILDLLPQSQTPRQEREVPLMNPSVPPPPLPQSRTRPTRLADNKPFPASLASQVWSSAPAQHRSVSHHHHHQQQQQQPQVQQQQQQQQQQLPPLPARAPSVTHQRAESVAQQQQHQGVEEAIARHFSAMAMHDSRNSMGMYSGQEHMYPPSRCYPPYMPGPFPQMGLTHPPPSHIFTPYFNLSRAQHKKLTSSQRLHAHLEVCYEQFRQLEKERKQTEARLASCLPGRHWSSANTLPVPKLPPNPTRVDRLIIDNIREHCRLLTLVGKMEHLGAYKVPLTVHLAISHWKAAVQRVEEARRAELEAHKLNHNLLVFRGPAAAACIDEAKMEEKLEGLVTSIRQLFAGIRGARTACWATLTCTVLSVQEQQTEAAEATLIEAVETALEVKVEGDKKKDAERGNDFTQTEEEKKDISDDK